MTLRTLNYGNYAIFLIMGTAGFCPSTVRCCSESINSSYYLGHSNPAGIVGPEAEALGLWGSGLFFFFGRVWGLFFFFGRVWGLGFRVWGLGFRVWGFRVDFHPKPTFST